MRVLVACEFSGVVRDAFAAKGHDAWSCDLLPTERPGKHLQCLLQHVLAGAVGPADFDLMIAHPPCTYLAVSGARWMKYRIGLVECALDFVRDIMQAPIRMICVENPIGVISSRIRKPDQVIQPWMFGHGETKATCLWLKNRLLSIAGTHNTNRPRRTQGGRKVKQKMFQPNPDEPCQWCGATEHKAPIECEQGKLCPHCGGIHWGMCSCPYSMTQDNPPALKEDK